MILLIDNYDSFTYNLVHYAQELGAEVEVVRNDALSVDEVRAKQPRGIILSPGPCDPDQAGICLEVIDRLKAEIPMLGVCLGHQAIGQAFGAKIVRITPPMHGKTSRMVHEGQGVFAELPSPFTATRYHSLIIDEATLPAELKVTARVAEGEIGAGTIMGVQHQKYALHGVQFHPESIASEHGHRLLKNFLNLCGEV